MAPDYQINELLITYLARYVADAGHVVTGAISPIPAASALLAERRAGGRLRATILGSRTRFPFTNGGVELFDAAGRGRIDVFFLSGGQIDGEANLNLVGTGAYPRSETRFPGSFGSAYMYFTVPRVILFREEHSPRVLVPKVDFISAPGVSPPEVTRRGGPSLLITNLAVMTFDKTRARFRLDSVHPGVTVDEVTAATGFAFDRPERVPETPRPTAEDLAEIRGPVRQALAETYPKFADRLGTAA